MPLTRDAAVTSETLGAWLLKANPDMYPIADWIRRRPEAPVTTWSVQPNRRAALMRAGQPVYLWVSGDGAQLKAGIWGQGYVTGPCEGGAADEYWSDAAASGRARHFAQVEISFLASPIRRVDLKADPRLRDIEVLRVPSGSNPSFLTKEQAAIVAGLAQAVDRGTCPRCGSWEIQHVVFGLVVPRAVEDSPPWVRLGGCLVDRHRTNRHCPDCSLSWLGTAGGGVKVRTFAELKAVLGHSSTEDFEDWLYDSWELDVFLEGRPLDDDAEAELPIRIDVRGVNFEFPFTLAHFITSIDELEDEVIAALAEETTDA